MSTDRMTTQPSDWAVAAAFREFSEFMYVDRDHVLARARELDASGGVIPMDKGPWRAGDDGKDVFSGDFTADVALRISGDFIDGHHRKDYAAWLARTLNDATRAQASAYEQANPLGGPATMFDTIARRIRAGEPYDEVLADYGLARAAEAGDKDGERYRFLRANAVHGRFESDDGSLALNCDEPENEWDAHIDAAMTGGLAGGGGG